VARLIVALSGHVSAGKTTLCDLLVERFNLVPFHTKDLIRELAGEIQAARGAMQTYGELLDRQTNGRWVCDGVTRRSKELPEDAVIVVDAVRIQQQVDALRQAYGPRVFHIHLTAPRSILANRYPKRRGGIREFTTYDRVLRNATERQVERLAAVADAVIDTNLCTKGDVLSRAASRLGLYGRQYLRTVDVIVGGQYGSEGKGHIVSYLAREYDMLVRVGGPNAGHTVYEEPKPYTFHHLPSGTRASGAQLIIAAGAVVDVGKLLTEIAECGVEASRLSIDPQTMTISSADKRGEQALVRRIGSTGQGVGYATARRIRDRRPGSSVKLARDIPALKPFLRETGDVLDRAFAHGKRVLLEGTQGTGLSLYHGYYPYVTSRDTTVAGCLAEAGISPSRVRKVIMVCRTYPIRVQSPAQGTSGPMSQPLTWREIARRSRVPLAELRRTERTSTTHRKRRVSEFDWHLLRKAASLNAPTDIALTFADYISIDNRKARRFEQLTTDTIHFIEEIERVAAAPVSLVGTRFHSRSIIDRRAW
jgi:adenylosuccinate synthase